MRHFLRPLAGVFSIACLAAGLAIVSTGGALAQAQPAPPPLKQMALTDKQIQGVLTAAKDMDAITQKLPPNAAPSPKAVAQLDAVAKKNGFASYDEYNDVVDNITLVLSGFDPVSQKICRVRSGDKGADRSGPGQQADVGQGQEGCAG